MAASWQQKKLPVTAAFQNILVQDVIVYSNKIAIEKLHYRKVGLTAEQDSFLIFNGPVLRT